MRGYHWQNMAMTSTQHIKIAFYIFTYVLNREKHGILRVHSHSEVAVRCFHIRSFINRKAKYARPHGSSPA